MLKLQNRLSLRALRTPANRIMVKTIRRNVRLLVINFVGLFFAASLEGATLGLIFSALDALSGSGGGALFSAAWIQDLALTHWLLSLEPLTLFVTLVAIACGAQVLQSLATYTGKLSARMMNARVQAQLQETIFAQIMRFSFPFASSYKVGDLISYVNEAAETVKVQIRTVNILISSGLTAAVYIGALLLISVRLSLISAGIGLGMILLQRFLLPRIRQASIKSTESIVDINKFVTETLQSLRLVFTEARQTQVVQGLRDLNVPFVHYKDQKAIYSEASTPVNRSLVILAVGILLIVGSFVVGDSSAQVLPALGTFIVALYRLANQLQLIATSTNDLANNEGGLQRLNQILGEADKDFEVNEGAAFDKLTNAIEFKAVSLQYVSDAQPAVTDLNLALNKNSITALVGASGAGKSTIADLLIGLYQPTAGEILIDGKSLAALNPRDWRSKLGVVSQDIVLLNASISDNIRYSSETPTQTDIEHAAKLAQAHSFIQELPQGYDTVIGERGYRLSGGQRQRLALARAILKQPQVLILDEATSALDSESEQLIQDALAEITRDRAVLVIAHRLSTITNADQILLLDAGKIVERGSHSELLAQNGKYAQYWKLQAEG